jgi:hypothetical protein
VIRSLVDSRLSEDRAHDCAPSDREVTMKIETIERPIEPGSAIVKGN